MFNLMFYFSSIVCLLILAFNGYDYAIHAQARAAEDNEKLETVWYLKSYGSLFASVLVAAFFFVKLVATIKG